MPNDGCLHAAIISLKIRKPVGQQSRLQSEKLIWGRSPEASRSSHHSSCQGGGRDLAGRVNDMKNLNLKISDPHLAVLSNVERAQRRM